MSSRARKKLAKQNDILSQFAVSDDDNEQFIDEIKFAKKNGTTRNNFDLLLAEENNRESSSDGEVHTRREDAEVTELQCKNGNKKTGKKKKKKKKKKEGIGSEVDDNDLKSNDLKTGIEDEIDRSVREVNELLGIKQTMARDNDNMSNESAEFSSSRSILAVEHRNLNPENEMRKKFGSNVVGGERRRNAHRRQPARSVWLVNPRPNWKPASKTGLTMKLLENKDGVYHFTFEHLPSYQEIQFKFMEAVDSANHHNLVDLLNHYPNHIDSLLQLSEVCKISEDHQMAAELIERALYIFERNFHTLFNVTRCNSRLEYRRAENRAFFLALFRHMTYIGDRACYRTSLEFCKFILGLDPEDPLAVLLLIDFYALKSEQYDYLIQLFNEWEVSKNLLKLPNYSFSVPLAMFHSQKFKNEKASQMLQDALIKFPTTLLLLMDKCGVVLKDEIIQHPYFQRTNDIKQSDGLNRLIALYVGRNFSLWKIPEVLDWLADCALGAIKRLEANDPLQKQWEPLWKYLYQKVPYNIFRHIIISDIKEAARSLPPEISSVTVNTYDPLPPPDSISGYTIQRRSHENDADGFLSLFLRSLLPSFGTENQQPPRAPQQPLQQEAQRQQPQGAEAIVRPGVENRITESAQRLMGAMRELLNSMTYRGDLDEVGNDDEGGFEEADWEDPEEF
ncbi:ribosome quality control complex subunit TCF25-like [Rhopilema esculentum]|uniref:ribosome quality control complex subunit TCF25-like n=1 Tax=Rhopilema esculentum TaxID=499914 RepID=UPI0031E053CF